MIGFKYTSNIFTMFVLQQSDLKCYLLDNLLLLTGTTFSGICFHFHLIYSILCTHFYLTTLQSASTSNYQYMCFLIYFLQIKENDSTLIFQNGLKTPVLKLYVCITCGKLSQITQWFVTFMTPYLPFILWSIKKDLLLFKKHHRILNLIIVQVVCYVLIGPY